LSFRAFFLGAFLVACGSSKSEPGPGVELDSAIDDAAIDVAAETSVDAGPDSAPFPVKRLPCVQRSSFANDLPAGAYGAIEAELVTIIPPGMKGCPGDTDHVHLQIAVGDKRYDVAMTVDSMINAPLAIHLQTLPDVVPDLGFAMATFDYERDLGTPSADFAATAKDALVAKLVDALKDAGRIRVFGQIYDDGTGIHFVHRQASNRDGVLIVHRVEAMGADRAIALRFSNQVF
jgi:hypothetical protein